MNFEGLELILQASLPVQIILAILCLASLLSWVLIFEKYFSLTRSVKSSHEIEDRFWEGEKLSDLYTDLKEKELAELETSELVLVTIYDSYNNKKNADSIDGELNVESKSPSKTRIKKNVHSGRTSTHFVLV